MNEKELTTKYTVMVVDDEVVNCRLVDAILTPLGYRVVTAQNGKEALEKVESYNPDVILLDIMMPVLDGFQTVQKLKSDEHTRLIPVVMVTALQDVEDRVKALEAGADDFLTKPIEKVELHARVNSLIKVKSYNDQMKNYQQKLEEEVLQRTEELTSTLEKLKFASLDTILRLSKAAEYRDEDTGAHILRMSNYASLIAEHMGLPSKTVEAILYAAPLHDIGKIGIPDSILLKPGKLTPNEWEIMKKHTLFGAKILEGSEGYLQFGRMIALTHHEKWDGSGYPRGLKGTSIPLAGRIVAIADVFDALSSKRPYKEPFSIEKTFSIIRESSGSHLDPEVVDTFFKISDEIQDIRNTYKDNGHSIMFEISNLLKDEQ
ncbi:MAG: HD domain-containing phosphohydrolase [Spirochaetota bacterium]